MAYLVLAAGLAVLVVGAEVLVRGASRLAASFGISPLVVGLTVVAFGTSAPELIVSVSAASAGQSNIALGNVVGSNIANVLFILGLSASILPIAVTARVIRVDVPLMIGISLGFTALALDERLSRGDGLALFAGIVLYSWWNAREGRRAGTGDATPVDGEHRRRRLAPFVLVLVGLGGLWLGGRWFVEGASGLARAWGLSELVIGLTVVALGTSLPELATSVVASVRGERDIAVGNVVGSNVFNLLAVMGAAAVVAPDGIAVAPTALRFDIPVMIATAAVCLPIVFTGATVARWEGMLFVAYYAAYVGFIVMHARGAALAPFFGEMMLYVVIPLTVATLAVLSAHAWRRTQTATTGRAETSRNAAKQEPRTRGGRERGS